MNSIIGDLPLHNYISCEQKVGQQFDKDGIGLLGRIGSFGAVITLALYVAAVMVSYIRDYTSRVTKLYYKKH